uniref:Uncharacterized protein n=1 Tax=Kalanchoe fedtschenkoi TaxID=63787 RepID=A0A7N0TFZ1_KALFE
MVTHVVAVRSELDDRGQIKLAIVRTAAMSSDLDDRGQIKLAIVRTAGINHFFSLHATNSGFLVLTHLYYCSIIPPLQHFHRFRCFSLAAT